MAWALHDHQPDRRGQAGRLELVTTYWRMLGPSQRPLVCALYQTAAGLEVRAGYEPDDLVRSQLVASELAGETVAEIWKEATVAVGGFLDLDAPQ